MSTLGDLIRLGDPPKGRLAVVAALGSFTVLLGVGLMSLAGYVISRAAERPPILELTVAMVAVRACGIGRPVSRYFERLRSHDLAFRVLARIRVAFVRHLEPQVPAQEEAYRRGDLLARIVDDVDATQELFLRGITPPIVAVIAGTISILAAALFVPAAGGILAAGLLLGGVVVPALAVAAAGRTGRGRAELRAELTAEVVELVRGAPELVVLGADVAARERIADLDATLARRARRAAVAAGAIEVLGVLVAGLTVAGVLAVAAAAAGSGMLDRVLVASVALLAMASFEAVAPLPAAALELRETAASGRRVLDVVDRAPAVRDPAEPEPLPDDPTVTLRAVDVRYATTEDPVLHQVDLRIAPGERVALTGPSGAGKSTVAALLVRFLDPAAGAVTIGGIDLRELTQHDVRSANVLDGQDAYLFATTIRENVRLARPAAGDDELRSALARAGLEPWIASLPDGVNTFVGEEGTAVSGGERRRIALARTFLAGGRVLVLDEPTAHLDPPTADAIVRDALDAADGRSVVLITHRPEGLGLVDRTLRLRRGELT